MRWETWRPITKVKLRADAMEGRAGRPCINRITFCMAYYLLKQKINDMSPLQV